MREHLEAGQFVALAIMIVALPLSESVKNVAFALALGCWILRLLIGDAPRARLTVVGAAQALIVAVAVASAFVALDRLQGFRGVWDMARAWLTFLLVLNTVTSWERLKRCWALFVGAAAAGSLVGLWQFLSVLPQAIEARTHADAVAVKVLSLGHPNHTATYLLMMIVLALSYLSFAGALKERRYWWLFALGAAVMIPSMFLTFSRSAGLTFMVILLVLGLAQGRGRLAMGVVAALLVGSVGVTYLPVVKRHFLGTAHPFYAGAIAVRLKTWRGTLSFVGEERPLLGAGPRNFNYIDKKRYGIKLDHAHSLYFSVLAEMGWLGAGALVLWFGSIVVVGWRSRRSLTTPWGRVVWMGALGCFITITLSGVMTTTFHTEGAMAFSAIIGLLLAAPHLPAEEPGVPLEARPSLTTLRRT
ncbi:MAG: O-antigen ligase family protein [bacterium]|nr:O-antigen ligase family protein [bacterium]